MMHKVRKSLFMSFRRCPQQGMYMYRDKDSSSYGDLNVDVPALAMGQIFHHSVEDFWQYMKPIEELEKLTDDEIYDHFHSLFQTTKHKDMSSWFTWYSNYEVTRFKKFKELNKLQYYKPFRMEDGVEYEMDGLIRTGHFDRIDRVSDNELVIVEYKTGFSYDPSKETAVSNVRAETQWYKSIIEGLPEYKDYKVVGWLLINPTVGKTLYGKFAPQTRFAVNKHANVIREMLDGDRAATKKYGYNCMYCDWAEECLKYDEEGHEIFGLLSEELKAK